MYRKNLLKQIGLYFLLFIFYFLCLQFFYAKFNIDVTSTYGYSYALTKGEIPYNDFNLIVPIFCPFLYSIFLFINHSIVTFYFQQALILTILSGMLFKILGKTKAWLFIICMTLPYPPLTHVIFPGYNFLIVFLFITITYLEKINQSDKLIGILLGLTILTKHTIGFLFCIPTLIYYRKNIKKIFTRYLYCLIPISFFLIYLLITKSAKNFINLAFLGMFDFSTHNFDYMLEHLILIIVLSVANLLLLIKKKDISFFYLLMSLSFIYPIMDFYHCSFYVILFIYTFLLNFQIIKKEIKYIDIISFFIIVFIGLSWFLIPYSKGWINIYHYHNYPFLAISKEYKESYDKINKFIKNKETIFLIFNNEINFNLTTINERKISYYTLLNYGNFGYNGTDRILKKLSKEKNKYIIMEHKINDGKFDQTIFELANYVKNNCQYVKRIGIFDVYYKK